MNPINVKESNEYMDTVPFCFRANFSNVFVNASLSFAMPNLMLQMQGFDYDYEVGNFHVSAFSH